MRDRVILSLSLAAALGWSAMTFERCLAWESDETLWLAAVNETPTKPRPLVNLGLARQLRKDYDGAEVCYLAALEAVKVESRSPYQRNFTWAVALVNLSVLSVERGNVAEARERISLVRSRYPSFVRGEEVERLVIAMGQP